MLRRWPQGGVGPTRAALQLQVPQRAFWGRAVEILNRLSGADAKHSEVKADEAPAEATTDVPATTDRRVSGRDRDIPLRARPQKGTTFPMRETDVKIHQLLEGKRAYTGLSRHLAHAANSEQLLDAWSLVSHCRPFVVADDGIRLVSQDNHGESKDQVMPVLQMLPADVFAEQAAAANVRTMFVTNEPTHPEQRASTENDAAVPNGKVIAANEAVVVALLVEYFSTLADHNRAINFFEAYNKDRHKWLMRRLTSDDSKDDAAMSAFERNTRLWVPARVGYLKSLMAKKSYQKLPQFARDDSRNLEVICWSGAAMSRLLRACAEQKDSALALLAIETMSTRRSASFCQMGFYELAINVVVRNKTRNHHDLENGIKIAHRMVNDAGYILQPDMWFALFNTSLHMNRTDCALEVFGLYLRDGVSPYQDSFRRALRKACRLNYSETALTMIHQWIAVADDSTTDGKSEEGDMDPKADLLKFVLSEMLVCKHPISSIREMVGILESLKIAVEDERLRWLINVLFDDDIDHHSPHDAIKKTLDFWKKHRSSHQAPGLVMHLLLEKCLKRQWLDECELVVSEINALDLERVPCKTLVQVMDANNKCGRFVENVKMCDKLLTSLPRAGFKSLNQHFYDRYLKSLLCLGHYDKVRKQHAALNLDLRFGKNKKIAASLREADGHLLQKEASR